MLDVAVRGSAAFAGSYQASPTVLSTACREQIRGHGANALLTRLRRGAQRPERAPREVARMLVCALNDSASLTEVSRWFEPQDSDAVKFECLRALEAWPGAEAVRARALTNMVRELSGSWSVGTALLQYAREPLPAHLLDELASPLRTAGRRQARGFDPFYRASCVDLPRASRQRAEVCAELLHSSERAWEAKRSAVGGGGSGGTVAAIVASTLVAGAIGTAYATRESDASRVIASGSGALCGFTGGVGLGGLVLMQGGAFGGKGGGNGAGAALLGFGLLAGVGGGFAGYALSRNPGARAPVTAGGLALPYLVTLGIALQ